ncbi:MAG: aspartate carbamoyltransferase regulatory subunit [Patescibacteria group bacterium]|nr:aspartate carbamoyltransferase regulatory subunit [Patescibacteria group bacterium]
MGIKHVLSISDFSADEIFGEILTRCEEKVTFVERRIPREPDPTKKVQLLFLEPSTRTRGSNVEAAQLLGYRTDEVIGKEASSFIKKETFANTARMFAKYNAGIIIARAGVEGAQKFMAELLEREGYHCAVHNAGDRTNQHPTQTILDLLTLKRHLGRVDDFTIGFFGDLKYGRTVHSLLCALSYQESVKVKVVQTSETALQAQYIEMFPGRIETVDSLEGLEGCDVAYGSRLQEERFKIDQLTLDNLRKKLMITPAMMKILGSVLFMHPMPYVQEFPFQVRSDKRIIIDDQAWCGVPVRVALQEMSFENLGMTNFFPYSPEENLSVIENCSLKNYRKSRQGREKKFGVYFNPIDNGTVIDKIPAELGLKVKSFLLSSDQLKNSAPIHHIDRIFETSLEGGKEVLILRDNFVSEETKMLVTSWAPTITFNEIREDRFLKIRAKKLVEVQGFGRCPNKNCITNNDPEAATKFVHVGDALRCWYCEKKFERSQIV